MSKEEIECIPNSKIQNGMQPFLGLPYNIYNYNIQTFNNLINKAENYDCNWNACDNFGFDVNNCTSSGYQNINSVIFNQTGDHYNCIDNGIGMNNSISFNGMEDLSKFIFSDFLANPSSNNINESDNASNYTNNTPETINSHTDGSGNIYATGFNIISDVKNYISGEIGNTSNYKSNRFEYNNNYANKGFENVSPSYNEFNTLYNHVNSEVGSKNSTLNGVIQSDIENKINEVKVKRIDKKEDISDKKTVIEKKVKDVQNRNNSNASNQIYSDNKKSSPKCISAKPVKRKGGNRQNSQLKTKMKKGENKSNVKEGSITFKMQIYNGVKKSAKQISNEKINNKKQKLDFLIPGVPEFKWVQKPNNFDDLLKKSKSGELPGDLSFNDLEALLDKRWLNDKVISNYIELIVKRNNCQPNIYPNIYAFDTYFLTTLKEVGYTKIANWTKKVNIFEKDMLLMPLNISKDHWALAVINFKKKRFEYYDSKFNLTKSSEVFKLLINYITQKYQNENNGKIYDFSQWREYVPNNTPQQKNDFDCGPFTCMFALFVSSFEQDIPFPFNQHDISHIRFTILYEILSRKLLG